MPVHLKYRPLVIWRQLMVYSPRLSEEKLAYNQENLEIYKENLNAAKKISINFVYSQDIQWWHATE